SQGAPASDCMSSAAFRADVWAQDHWPSTSRGASAISKPRTVAVLKRFLSGWRRGDCRDNVGTDSGAVRRPNKALQCARYNRDNETTVVRRQGGIGSTKHVRSAETCHQTGALSGSDKQTLPIGEAIADRTVPAEPRQQIGVND